MNLFVAGYSTSPIDAQAPPRALAGLLAELPFFDPAAIETWEASSGRAVMAAVAHPASVTGGVRYTAFEEHRAALFSGRPVRWSDDGHPDGLGALDPASYHAPAERWAHHLDGRCTVVRAGEQTLELYSDPLGAYPVFELRQGQASWFSNSAEVLRRISGDRGLDEESMASVLASGWSLRGQPVWRAVRRVPRGVVLRLDEDGREHRRELLAVSDIAGYCGRGLDAGEAAGVLGELTGALADWPGRPSVVPVTGGRDSRLVLAAALRAGVEFEARTGGDPASPDVIVGAQLSALAGLPHGLLAADPHGNRFSDLARAARFTALASGGTATLADADGFPLGPRTGPLPLWHSGQGGEIARAYYGPGRDRIADHLYVHFVGRRPGRTEIISAEAGELLRRRIGAFVEDMKGAGTAAVDVPDLFYLLERMGCWAAPSHGVVELVRDTTSPLWSARLLPYLLGLPSHERALDGFHLRVLRELAPELVDLPFQDGSGWPKRRSGLGRRIERGRTLTVKAKAELGRQVAGLAARRKRAAPGGRAAESVTAPRPPAPGDPFEAVLKAVQEAAHSQASHPAWNVLDRKRVTRLLASPAVELDAMNRMYVWRLGSAFLGLS